MVAYPEFARSTAAAHGLPRIWDWPLFIDEVERGFKTYAWSQGYSVLIQGNALEGQQDRVRDLASRVDAVAVMPNSMPAELRDALATQLPLVAIAEMNPAGTEMWQVGTDNREAMAELTRHLVEVHGHRDLRFIGSGSVDYDIRFEGFQEALRAAGLQPPSTPEGGFGSAWHAHETLQTVRTALADGVPDVFVCASDLHAAYAIAASSAEGLAVPDDVAITGFDDLQGAEFSHPPLTTVRQPMHQMGAAAARAIIEAVHDPALAPTHRVQHNELVIRRSCGCAPAASGA